MDNHNPVNAPLYGNENPTSQNLQAKNSKGAQSWYGRLSDEERAEYNQKRRTTYKEKKAAAKNTNHNEQVCQAQASASSLLCVRDGICTSATSESAHHQTEHMSVRCNKRTATMVPDMQTEDHNPGASLSGTVELFPTTTPVHGHGNENSNVPRSWYARLSNEKRAEYNLKRRTLYKEIKAATLNTVNHDQVSQPHASCLLGLHRTPFSDITNTLDDVFLLNTGFHYHVQSFLRWVRGSFLLKDLTNSFVNGNAKSSHTQKHKWKSS